jgi:homoserine kinase
MSLEPRVMQARARAPASIGNVGVGYDILGLAFEAVFDTVTAEVTREAGVHLGEVTGLVNTLPAVVAENTALAAADALMRAAAVNFGVRLHVHKGVPISSGMGGSAASAVAAASAVNALLSHPFSKDELLPFCLEGERASADPPPYDNVIGSLYGGMRLAASFEPPRAVPVPLPQGLTTVLVHPDMRIETRAAREVLSKTVTLSTAVNHARHVAAFMVGCSTGDLDLVRTGLRDVLVEPQRRILMPAFDSVQRAALENGALGCSFSGAGPSMFAWVDNDRARAVGAAMHGAFERSGLSAKVYEAPLDSQGVEVEAMERAAA